MMLNILQHLVELWRGNDSRRRLISLEAMKTGAAGGLSLSSPPSALNNERGKDITCGHIF